MKPANLVDQMLETDSEPAREPTPSLTVPDAGMSRYPKDEEATRNAVEKVGDGQQPDEFFVSIGDEFYEDEPEQSGESYSIGQFADPKEAEKMFNNVELNGAEGPRWVSVENRLKGLIKQRYLKKVVSYQEETRD